MLSQLNIYIKFLFHFILTTLIWSTLTIDSSANEFTVSLALLFTLAFGFTINSMKGSDSRLYTNRYLLVIPPFLFFLYFILFVRSISIIPNIILHPILWICILLIICFNKNNWLDIKSPAKRLNLIYLIVFILLYSIFLYPKWKSLHKLRQLESFNIKEDSEYPNKNQSLSVDLSKYKFIDPDLDTIQISNSKYTLIETWNESCPPCLKAFQELPKVFDDYKNQIDIIYLYESKNLAVLENLNDVFSYKPIPNKDKILIDADQNLYTDLEMQGFPYFLLFDQNGEIVFKLRGYNKEQKTIIENRLKEIFIN